MSTNNAFACTRFGDRKRKLLVGMISSVLISSGMGVAVIDSAEAQEAPAQSAPRKA